jgi:hypothetical protein
MTNSATTNASGTAAGGVGARPFKQLRQHDAEQDGAIGVGGERALQGQEHGGGRRDAKPPGIIADQQVQQRKEDVELDFDADDPGVHEDREHVGIGIFRHQRKVVEQPLHEPCVFIGERRQRIERDPVDQDRGRVGRHDAEEPPDQERTVGDAAGLALLADHQHGEQIPADGEEYPDRRPSLQVGKQRDRRDVGCHDEQKADRAQPVETRPESGGLVVGEAQFVAVRSHRRVRCESAPMK